MRYWVLALACASVLACVGDDDDGQTAYQCPEKMPAADAACDRAYATCTYMRCDEFGVATATCRDDLRWDVSTGACGEVYCEQETCAPGFICVRTVSGAVFGMCVEDTCEGGPIGCECPGCEGQGCNAHGLTIECNGCSASVCP